MNKPKKILFVGAHSGGGIATANNMVFETFLENKNFVCYRLNKDKYKIKNKYIKYTLLYIRCLYGYVMYRPNIIFAQVSEPLYKEQSFVLFLAKKILGKKVKTIAHLHARPDLSRIPFKLMKKSENYIDGIITISTLGYQKILSDFNWKNRILYLPNFIKIPQQYYLGNDLVERKFILYIGRMHEKKGIFEIIEIAKILKNERFVFIGDFNYKDKIVKRKFLNEIEHCNNIEWLGSIFNDDKYNYIRKSKCLIFPSAWRGEIFPLTIIECGLFRVPSFVTAIGAIPEIITNGENGVFIENNDPVKNVSIINEYLSNKEKMEKISINIHNSCLNLYTLEANKEKLHQFISSL